jgi:hypothetical protein
LYLRGVFDQQDAFFRGNELSERVQKRRLARSCSATNQKMSPLQNVVFKAVRKSDRERPSIDEVCDLEVADVELGN